jgi:Zn-finger in ubiquitin-hydrolases and other protein
MTGLFGIAVGAGRNSAAQGLAGEAAVVAHAIGEEGRVAMTAAVDPSVPPSGIGCAECDAAGGWWVHLRRCAACGHIGCCDDSLARHATKHWRETGHPVIRSFEPGEDWFWDYETNGYYEGPELAPPQCHPEDQTVPGPRGRVPRNWADLLRQQDD